MLHALGRQHTALVDLLGKPIAESSALCIPTGVQPFPGGPSHVYRFISGSAPGPMCELGWKSLGVLELTALPSIKEEHWIPEVEEIDALLVWGGSPLYLCYWMRQSGLADLLPSLQRETVYVGTSGGAMVATPDFGGETYDDSDPLTGSDRALGLVDFSLFPLERRTCRTLPWPTSKDGPPGYQYRRTRLTTRPPSRWSTAPSKSSPRGTGSCSPPARKQANRARRQRPLGCASVRECPPGDRDRVRDERVETSGQLAAVG
jgi:hypothetical protein